MSGAGLLVHHFAKKMISATPPFGPNVLYPKASPRLPPPKARQGGDWQLLRWRLLLGRAQAVGEGPFAAEACDLLGCEPICHPVGGLCSAVTIIAC